MTKALIYCEIDRFNRDRVESIHQLVGSLAAIQLEIALTTNIKWTEVVAGANIETEKFAHCMGLLQQAMDDEDLFSEA
jgi:1,2-phenylacetyl-CoA epoxidase PaaB subunit